MWLVPIVIVPLDASALTVACPAPTNLIDSFPNLIALFSAFCNSKQPYSKAFQADCREFESRLPLIKKESFIDSFLIYIGVFYCPVWSEANTM